jgi:ABC-type Zn uptake system ZnuABC Zn-binding protein ZnuA
MQVKYTEEAPVKQTLIFEDYAEFGKFFGEKFNAMYNLYNGNYQGKWIYEYFKIRKDGGRSRHSHNPSHLWKNPQAIENQRKGFQAYLEKKRAFQKEKTLRKNLAEIDFKIEQLQKERQEIINENLKTNLKNEYN